MRLLTLLGILAFWVAPSAFAAGEDCPGSLITFPGRRTAVTLVLNSAGKLETWDDSLTVMAAAPKFSKTTDSFPVGGMRPVTALSAAFVGKTSQRLFAAAEKNGVLSLVSPLGTAYPFLPTPALESVTAVTFQTTADPDQASLFVGSGRKLFRLKMSWREVDDSERDLQTLLMRGMVRVTQTPAQLPGQKAKITYTAPQVPVFDFADGATYLLGTLDPQRALVVSGFEEVLSFKEAVRMNEIDHISILDDHRAVVASRLGQVLLIDYQKKKTLLEITFSEPVLLGSLSAHIIGENVEVWGVGSGNGTIYHWNTAAPGNWFKKMPAPTPKGVIPVRLATAGYAAPSNYTAAYFSNVVMVHKKPYIERILVQGSDGNLYGYVEGAPGIIVTGPVERRWMKWEAANAK